VKESYSIFHDLEILASRSEIFQAITSPAMLEKWWPLRCSGVPKIGESYNLYFTSEYDWWGEVIEYEKDTKFRISMTKSDSDWNPTNFGFELVEARSGVVRVEFSHLGWPEINEHFRRSSYCWALLLKGLQNYLEEGIILPFEMRG
jgi:uncharacterized protein YndB with AHSA1/START domain